MIFSPFCDKFSGRKFDVLWYLRKYFAQIEKVLRKFRKQNLCWRRVWLIRQLSKTDSDIREMDSNQIFRCSGWTVHLVQNHAGVLSQQMISAQWDVWQNTMLLLIFIKPSQTDWSLDQSHSSTKHIIINCMIPLLYWHLTWANIILFYMIR